MQMLFPSAVPTSDVSVPTKYNNKYDKFLHHIVDSSEKLTAQGSQTFSALRQGQLIFHTLNRPLSETHLMQLATLARLTHDKHFNTRKYKREEILVPGGLSFALTCSLASRDLHEVIYEDLVASSFPNNLCPGETVCRQHMSDCKHDNYIYLDIIYICTMSSSSLFLY